MIRTIAFFGLLSLPLSALAVLPAPDTKTGIAVASLTDTDDYRLGDEWGKKPVTRESLASARPAFRRAALATASTGGGTGFYLGEFAGQHVVATNHHVFPSSCTGRNIRFPLLGVVAVCDKFLGSWDSVDLALFTVRVASAADAEKLEAVGANFQFRDEIQAGQALLTVGFGVAGNPLRQLMANEDSDCYAFSGAGEYRLMADPDRWNPSSYRAWSFALGCDVSHGDSGSAIVDRESGKVVGIIWTGRIPKASTAQSSQGLTEMFRARSAPIWEELSYAVPAKKIGEHLERLLEGGGMPEDHRQIVQALLR